MWSDETESEHSESVEKRFVTCGECGWVHYVMTAAEKAATDRFAARYNLNEHERFTYESAFRQCLYCEAPLSEFRAATARDLGRAEGHLVTPLLMEAEEIEVSLN